MDLFFQTPSKPSHRSFYQCQDSNVQYLLWQVEVGRWHRIVVLEILDGRVQALDRGGPCGGAEWGIGIGGAAAGGRTVTRHVRRRKQHSPRLLCWYGRRIRHQCRRCRRRHNSFRCRQRCNRQHESYKRIVWVHYLFFYRQQQYTPICPPWWQFYSSSYCWIWVHEICSEQCCQMIYK